MLNEHTMAAYEMCAFTYSTLSTAQCTVSQELQDQLLSHSFSIPMKIQYEVHGLLAGTIKSLCDNTIIESRTRCENFLSIQGKG